MAVFFGSDTSCVTDIGLVDVQITDPLVLIGQRIARRWQTPRGALALIGDDPNFGWDVRQYVNAKMGPNAKQLAQTQLESEALKDEQVMSAQVQMSLDNAGYLVVSGSFVTTAGPFSLTLNVGALTVGAVFSF